MASHTYYDYKKGKHMTISHDSEEYRVLMSGGESGGEVGESGDTVHTGVNSVPAHTQEQPYRGEYGASSKWSKEAWDRSMEKAKARHPDNPGKDKANRYGWYTTLLFLGAIGSAGTGMLFISAFLGLIAWVMLIVTLVTYVSASIKGH